MNPHLPGAGNLQQDGLQPFSLQPQQERAGTLWIGVRPINQHANGTAVWMLAMLILSCAKQMQLLPCLCAGSSVLR